MMTDRQARTILLGVWPGRSLAEYQIVQAIGRFEGNYGAAFDGANNWGASALSTAPTPAECPIGTTGTLDHRADGSPYWACITRFSTPDAGARSLVRALTAPRRPTVAAALRTGNAAQVARAMSRTGYMAQTPDKYAIAIQRNASTIARALGEPLRVTSSASSSRSSSIPLFVFVAAALEVLFFALVSRGRS